MSNIRPSNCRYIFRKKKPNCAIAKILYHQPSEQGNTFVCLMKDNSEKEFTFNEISDFECCKRYVISQSLSLSTGREIDISMFCFLLYV